jgi:hypothetical protein
MMDPCPCTNCLVLPACVTWCELALDFMNNISNQMVKATAADIHQYRITTPVNVKLEVEGLIRCKQKFAYPEYIKSCWHQKIPDYRKHKG